MYWASVPLGAEALCYMRPGTMIRISISLASVLAVALAGCSKKNDAPAPAETASAAPAVPPSALIPGTGPVGVPECDEYLRRFEACTNASGSPLAGSRPAFKAQRDSFRIAARTPEGKDGLKPLCQKMLDQLSADKRCPQPGK